MRVTAIYPGTFDPMTVGHVDVAARASQIFDDVIVAIGANSSKSPFFSLDERVSMATDILADLGNVTVQSFDGLLVDFVAEVKGKVIVRGLRAISDFDYEVQIAGVHRMLRLSLLLHPRITRFCLQVLFARSHGIKVMSVILCIHWYSMHLKPKMLN